MCSSVFHCFLAVLFDEPIFTGNPKRYRARWLIELSTCDSPCLPNPSFAPFPAHHPYSHSNANMDDGLPPNGKTLFSAVNQP